MYKAGKRPSCPYCKHKPFRTPTGYKWHLTHIHPNDEYIPVEKMLKGAVARLESVDKKKRRRSVGDLGHQEFGYQLVKGLEKVTEDFFKRKGGKVG